MKRNGAEGCLVDTVLRYRQYRCGELQRFFGNAVYFSRSSHFRARCPGRPDVIKTAYENEACGTAKGGLIRVILELDKCRASRATTRNQGQRLQINNPPPSGYKLRVREGQPTVKIIHEVQAIIDGILAGLPIAMYATALARQVRNYTEYMLSPGVKKQYTDIAELIEKRHIKSLSTIPLTHYGLIGNGSNDNLHVAQLSEGEWVAWIDGDELIPAFPDELLTYRFMKDRLSLYDGFKPSVYDELSEPLSGRAAKLT